MNLPSLPSLVALGLLATACGLPDLPEPPSSAGPSPAVADEVFRSMPPGEGPGARGCFRRHLEDAIGINRRRRSVYAEWSGGGTVPISRALIRAERIALIVAGRIDRRARRHQAAGIPIVCDEFVSMSLTPPLPDRPLPPPTYAPSPGPVADTLIERFRRAYGEGGFPAVAAASELELSRLAAEPAYHCMTRHLVESIWRVAKLAPHHARGAAGQGLPPTAPLSKLLLRLHLAVLEPGAALDRDAAPYQAAGIPILCRDVPPLR